MDTLSFCAACLLFSFICLAVICITVVCVTNTVCHYFSGKNGRTNQDDDETEKRNKGLLVRAPAVDISDISFTVNTANTAPANTAPANTTPANIAPTNPAPANRIQTRSATRRALI
ncbi:hypothetical protein EDB80DRAFT_779423 [Ilyonectria destructans]|nr:hypothetical protein EDB80DRAFT_779423 [Ilyonectria destructans]